jgi:hypothetical protein
MNEGFLVNMEEFYPQNTTANTSYMAVDIKNLGACSFATKLALFNLGGIVNSSSDGSTQQVGNFDEGLLGSNYTFNFCEASLPTPKNCPQGEFYAFVEESSGDCHGF